MIRKLMESKFMSKEKRVSYCFFSKLYVYCTFSVDENNYCVCITTICYFKDEILVTER